MRSVLRKKIAFTLPVLVVLSAAAALLIKLRDPRHAPAVAASVFQCPMHPQVRASGPDRCTLCGMDLTALAQPTTETRAATVSLSADAITVAGVRTAPVVAAPLVRTLRVAGVIEDNAQARYRVTAATAGRVEVLHVKQPGTPIAVGEPLVAIYSPALLTVVRRQAALRRLTRAPAPDGTPSLTLEQQRMLDGGDQQLILMGLSQAQCDALADEPANPTRTTLLAPIGGAVIGIFAQAGASFREGDALFEIADLSTRAFTFDAYEDDLPLLAAGQPLEIRAPAAPGLALSAKLGIIPVAVNPSTRLARFRVPIALPDGAAPALANHLFAEGAIRIETPAVLAVPRTAVLATGAAPLVYVEGADGHFAPRVVRLGRAGDEAWEILDGLADGERVVVAGAMLLDAQTQLHHPQLVEKNSPARH